MEENVSNIQAMHQLTSPLQMYVGGAQRVMVMHSLRQCVRQHM